VPPKLGARGGPLYRILQRRTSPFREPLNPGLPTHGHGASLRELAAERLVSPFVSRHKGVHDRELPASLLPKEEGRYKASDAGDSLLSKSDPPVLSSGMLPWQGTMASRDCAPSP
jgi:hypothetical protein